MVEISNKHSQAVKNVYGVSAVDVVGLRELLVLRNAEWSSVTRVAEAGQ